jgi:hypothetical protein
MRGETVSTNHFKIKSLIIDTSFQIHLRFHLHVEQSITTLINSTVM